MRKARRRPSRDMQWEPATSFDKEGVSEVRRGRLRRRSRRRVVIEDGGGLVAADWERGEVAASFMAKMATVPEDPPVRKKETKKFTWKISQFSKRTERELLSDTFSAGGHNWRIVFNPNCRLYFKHLAMSLEIADWETVPYKWSVAAEFTLTLVDQYDGSLSVRQCKGGAHNFDYLDYEWEFPRFVLSADFIERASRYIVRDTVIIEAEVSTEVAASEATNSEPRLAKTEEPLSLQNQEVQADSPFPPSSAQLTSRKLIAELSTMTSNCKSPSADRISSSADHGCGVVQQQREKMVEFFGMSLEAICQTISLDEVESTALKLAEHSTDPEEETILKALVSRLAEFKQVIPSSLATNETSNAAKSLMPQITKDMEVKLVQRKRKLSSLEVEVSRLGEEGMKLEAEIQQLSAPKAKLIDQRNSAVVKLEKANEEASKELEEFKKQCDENKQVIENGLKAKERLAQSNASWKLFKDNLGW
ncbi:unnamed protein product [Linum tenue]|uniref:MATH domain-containing protein n=1 Tax=Linum tenue TaxID=586396 RepID=A0AAV0IT43_9ROSI|nr:unnamed protein product [Linum tenue]